MQPPRPDSSTVRKEKRDVKITSACPQCGQRCLVQTSRRAIDRVLGLFVGLRRFRCQNLECGWEGNLAKSRALRRTVGQMPTFTKQVNWLLVAGNVVLALSILFIIIALFIGWIDGSFEGDTGLFQRETRNAE